MVEHVAEWRANSALMPVPPNRSRQSWATLIAEGKFACSRRGKLAYVGYIGKYVEF
jgi:hypothetical protein